MASTAQPPNGIVLFHYERSPYARRVRWYLAFRRIAYAECIQPSIMPRPDLKALGIKYRRTPSMAVGRDVYLDTRMIIHRLEQLFPASDQHPAFSTPETAGLASLLNKLVIDASLFNHAVTILPDNPNIRSEAFHKDRAGFYGPNWTLEDAMKSRPEGLVHVRECFGILESLLHDSRKWIGATEKPSLADLEGFWAIEWIITSLTPPRDIISEEIFPKVYSWHQRFSQALEEAKAAAPQPVTLESAVAVPAILGAAFTDKDLNIDGNDPTGLTNGAAVELFPIDGGGFTHQDVGRLVKLTKDEVGISVKAEGDGTEVRLHAPRWGFKVQAVSESRL
ncbi:hypothetical protein BDY17DRAFT_292973 [Neohortaea acidophila]|uniref:Uncharacterized protein n=1 Tax=Neohortaea acidophila TaxID=245834 RepID=A0A6A6PYP9_9PEZI|nr:uncharacterized protein BDY17DRAFT_292973 [Neohortaea acidophila]KAF2485122.1 hypothetical protein BDY17DRAFT_292973 [Neohortaea acidophila]